MKTEPNSRPTWPEPDPGLELTPPLAAPFRSTRLTDLEQLHHRLLRLALAEAENAELYPVLRRAANEATALAGATAYPLLVLPVLFEEKILRARRQTERALARPVTRATAAVSVA